MRVLLIIPLLITSLIGRAQLLDTAALDTVRWYTNLDHALKEPEKVYKLRLSKDKLTEFPMEILQFTNLNVLDLSKNKIKEIPDTISSLQYLQELNLMKNKIEVFSVGICELRNLKYLNMNQNRLMEIPKEIKLLSELRILDLWSNDLAEFPNELSHLRKLEEFDLRNILINEANQEKIRTLLPNANVYMDKPCNCGY